MRAFPKMNSNFLAIKRIGNTSLEIKSYSNEEFKYKSERIAMLYEVGLNFSFIPCGNY